MDSALVVLAVVVVLVVLGLKFVSKLVSMIPLGIAIVLIVLWINSRGGWSLVQSSYHQIDPNGVAITTISKLCGLANHSGS